MGRKSSNSTEIFDWKEFSRRFRGRKQYSLIEVPRSEVNPRVRFTQVGVGLLQDWELRKISSMIEIAARTKASMRLNVTDSNGRVLYDLEVLPDRTVKRLDVEDFALREAVFPLTIVTTSENGTQTETLLVPRTAQ